MMGGWELGLPTLGSPDACGLLTGTCTDEECANFSWLWANVGLVTDA